jgi:hypothetical protein
MVQNFGMSIKRSGNNEEFPRAKPSRRFRCVVCVCNCWCIVFVVLNAFVFTCYIPKCAGCKIKGVPDNS